MGLLKWYKRDPTAALEGMMVLTLEERGAYNTILDLIYARDGRLADDERFLAGWMRCDIRVWKRIRARLLELGKLAVEDGFLTNRRATSEVDEALHRGLSRREAGATGGRKSGEVRRKNKDLDEANHEAKSNTTTPTPRKKKEEDTPLAALDPLGDVRVEDAFAAFNQVAAEIGIPVAGKLTPERRTRLKARLKERGPEGWQLALDKLAGSTFCRGFGEKGWKADLDFLLSPTSFNKLLDGRYDERGQAQADLLATALQAAEDLANGIDGTSHSNGQRPHFQTGSPRLAAPAPPQGDRSTPSLDRNLRPSDRRAKPDRG